MDLTSFFILVGVYLVIHSVLTVIRAYLRNKRLSCIFTCEDIALEEFGRGIVRRAFKPGTFILAIFITLAIIIIWS